MATQVDKILVQVEADLGDLKRELQKLDKQLDESKRTTEKNMSAIGGAFRSLGPIIAGALTGVALKSIVDVASNAENLRIQLGYLFGDVDEGARAFEVMSDYASQVPFSLAQIEAAAQPLGAVAKDANELQTLLKLTGDVAAVTGLSFQEAGMQIQRSFSAGIGAADLLRDRGVTALLGFEQGVSYTAQETIAKFNDAFGPGGQFEGAANGMADTFDGTMSMLGDSLFQFQKAIGEAGFFDALKEEADKFNTAISENDEAVRMFAQNIGEALAGAIRIVSGFVEGAVSLLNDFFNFARGMGTALANEGFDALFMTIEEIVAIGEEVQRSQMALTTGSDELADSLSEQGQAAGQASAGLTGLSAAGGQANKEVEKLQENLSKLNRKNIVKDQKLGPQGSEKDAAFTDFLGGVQVGSAEELAKLEESFGLIFDRGQELEKLEVAQKLLDQKTAAQKLQEQLEALNLYMQTYGDVNGEVQKKIDETTQELKMQDPFLQSVIDSYEQAGQRISDSLADAFMNGKLSMESFKDISRQLISEIISNFLRLQVINPLINSMFGLQGSSALPTGSLGSAGGGSMHPTAPRIVGERGPELFVPHSAGTLLNGQNTKGALGGGGGVTVNQSLNFSLGVSDTVKAEIGAMMPIINQNAVAAVQTARMRGGSFAQAFGG